MNFKQLFTDDDAVSPVIGVILMVAITVILAAVIASFVLGLGNNATNTNPQASFGFDYEEAISDADAGDAGELTISHDGGDTIQAQELYVRGDEFNSTVGADVNGPTSWADTSKYGPRSEITSGQRLTAGVNSTYEVDIVYEAQEGQSSSTLASDDGPDA